MARARGRTARRRRGPVLLAAALAVCLGAGALPPATPTGAAPASSTASAAPTATATVDPGVVPGAGAARPRILFEPGQVDDLRARLDREPYRSLFLALHQRTVAYDTGHPLGDPSIVAQRDHARAAKNLAFEYALDRTVVAGAVVPFPGPAARAAAGDRAHDLLLNLYPRSRLAVPGPIGGWDRDINTSEEVVDYATAYDTLLGAGYDLGADGADGTIADRLGGLVAELHRNYVEPATAGGAADLMQNNHRSKVGAALAVAAVALAEWEPPAGSSGPADWFPYGAREVDDVLRFMLVAGDGAYGEGAYYYRYTAMNLLPYARVWERHVGPGEYEAGGVTVPSPTRQPLFARTQRWMLDTTVPDGGMAPIDDGNPNRSYYFGVLPGFVPELPAYYWRWANAPQPYDTDGAVDLGADAIVAYDDAVAPAPPAWSPTQAYAEGGTVTFRSGWERDAVMALALGEHDTASEFGRDRAGDPRAPQSHEHAEPGSFMLYAFGERLALDPGYLTFGTHGQVNQPEHHNVVLVDGKGPSDYLAASFGWLARPQDRPPAEGQSSIGGFVDGGGLDAATVATNYRDVDVDRRFLFPDDRYLVVADAVAGEDGSATPHELAWMVHGNGGGSSGGSFTAQPSGGRWEVGGARLDAVVGASAGPLAVTTADATHEGAYQQALTHTAVRASATAPAAEAVQLLYPTPAGQAPPTSAALDLPRGAGATLVDEPGDRRVAVARTPAAAEQPEGEARATLPAAAVGPAGDAATDGTTLLVDTHLDGRLRVAWADRATSVTVDGRAALRAPTARSLGLRLGDGRADLVGAPDGATPGPAAVAAGARDAKVTASGLGFVPGRVDGACGFAVQGEGAAATVEVRFTADSPATLWAEGGNGHPAADAGADRRVGTGSRVTLDGRASCDPDGDAITPSWELVSAPAGSAWRLDRADRWRPHLTADRPGPYRARLTVTDAHGAVSTEAEVLVVAGARGADGVDDDLDGRIDADDPDADGPEDAVVVSLPRRDQDESEPPVVRGGTTAAAAFATDRDPAGELTALSGRAVVGSVGTSLDVSLTRNDRGRWRGWLEVRDSALGGPAVRARVGAASDAEVTDVAPGIAHVAATLDGRRVAVLVVDHQPP